MLLAPTTATSRPSPSTRRGTATRSAPGCCWRCARRASGAAPRASRSRSGVEQRRRAGAVPAVRVRAGRACASATTARPTRTPSSCGPTTSTSPTYHARLRRASRPTSRARTVVDDERADATVSDSDGRSRREHVHPRHRDVVRRDGGRGRRRTAATCSRRSCRSQVDLHARFGGVVPEIASRAHVELLTPVDRPGARRGRHRRRPHRRGRRDRRARASSARCSSACQRGQGAALVWDVPFVGVNHLEAHLYAALLEEPDLELPLVVLLVSGGHTLLVEMEDHGRYRAARPDHRRRRRRGVRQGRPLPRPRLPGRPGDRPHRRSRATRRRSRSRGPMLDDGLDFSFSGLKTAVVNHVRKHPEVEHGRRRRVVPGGGGRRAA